MRFFGVISVGLVLGHQYIPAVARTAERIRLSHLAIDEQNIILLTLLDMAAEKIEIEAKKYRFPIQIESRYT